MRKVAREVAFKLVYEYLFLKERFSVYDREIVTSAGLDDKDYEYLNAVYNGVLDNFDEMTEKLREHTERFKLERIYKVDLAIMLVALYEMKNVEDVPTAVAINEAVEMSKIYSTEKSGGFINGVLAKLARENEKQ